MKKTALHKLIITAVCAVLLMSIVPVLIKWVNANPVTIGIVRLSIAALGIALLVLFSSKRSKVANIDLKWMFLLGFVFALHWYSYFVSLKLTDASVAAIGVSTFGIHLLLLSCLIKKESFKLTDILSVLLCLLGAYLASPNGEISDDKLQGFLLSIVSGFLYACLPLINKRIVHLTTQIRALGQFGFALVFFLLLWPQADFELTVEDWSGLILLGVVSTLIAHTLWLKVSTELPSNITAVIYYGYIPITMVLSFSLLNESMPITKLVGAGLIICANIMVVFYHNKTQPVP